MSTAADDLNLLTVFAEILDDMQEYLARVEKGCEQISLAFQSGDTSKALEMMAQVMEGFSFLLQLVENAERLYEVDFQTLFLEGNVSASSFVIDLNKLCGDIIQAAENKDYSLAGDLIEYDLPVKTGQAQEMLQILRRNIVESKGL